MDCTVVLLGCSEVGQGVVHVVEEFFSNIARVVVPLDTAAPCIQLLGKINFPLRIYRVCKSLFL